MAIIGISGKKSSGKDLVGKIIQYLIWKSTLLNKHTSKINFNTYLTNSSISSNWTIKRFGDLPKVIAGQILGIDNFVEQWEENKDRFRDKELGKEWWKHSIVPNVGYGSRTISYTGNKDKEHLTIIKLTYRTFLQQLATNSAREIHPNVWVNALMGKYHIEYYTYGDAIYVKQSNDSYALQGRELESSVSNNDMINLNGIKHNEVNWIITDVRFPNELKSIEDRGGIVIRVKRNPVGTQNWINYCNYLTDNPNSRGLIDIATTDNYYKWIGEHPSETALDNHKFTYSINNNGTIEELIKKVKGIIIMEELI